MTRRQKLNMQVSALLDWVFKPVTTRLTHDEYFSCRSRMDCTRTLFKRLVRS